MVHDLLDDGDRVIDRGRVLMAGNEQSIRVGTPLSALDLSYFDLFSRVGIGICLDAHGHGPGAIAEIARSISNHLYSSRGGCSPVL